MFKRWWSFFAESSSPFDSISQEEQTTTDHNINIDTETPSEPSTPNKQNECAVCMEPFTISHNEYMSPCINVECNHFNICPSCKIESIETKLSTFPFQLNCDSCHEKMDGQDVYLFLKHYNRDDLAESLNSKLNTELLGGSQECISCYNCNSVIIVEDPEFTQFVKCVTCGRNNCFTCKCAWHEGFTCEEHLTLVALEEEKSREEIDKITKTCPKCGERFAKDDRCDHVVCTNCKFEFCWSCGADYRMIVENDNSFHKETCRFHTSNLIDPPNVAEVK